MSLRKSNIVSLNEMEKRNPLVHYETVINTIKNEQSDDLVKNIKDINLGIYDPERKIKELKALMETLKEMKKMVVHYYEKLSKEKSNSSPKSLKDSYLILMNRLDEIHKILNELLNQTSLNDPLLVPNHLKNTNKITNNNIAKNPLFGTNHLNNYIPFNEYTKKVGNERNDFEKKLGNKTKNELLKNIENNLDGIKKMDKNKLLKQSLYNRVMKSKNRSKRLTPSVKKMKNELYYHPKKYQSNKILKYKLINKRKTELLKNVENNLKSMNKTVKNELLKKQQLYNKISKIKNRSNRLTPSINKMKNELYYHPKKYISKTGIHKSPRRPSTITNFKLKSPTRKVYKPKPRPIAKNPLFVPNHLNNYNPFNEYTKKVGNERNDFEKKLGNKTKNELLKNIENNLDDIKKMDKNKSPRPIAKTPMVEKKTRKVYKPKPRPIAKTPMVEKKTRKVYL